MRLWYLSLMLLQSTLAIQTGPEKDYYFAAVVEYSPIEGIDGNDTVCRNAQEYVKLIEQAAEHVDIILFPETAINFEDITVYMEVPFGDNAVAPADNTRLHPVLQMLSKAARDNKIYVAASVLEQIETSNKEVMRFNTNVVFDRTGKIVSRYRKSNLYEENHLNVTKVPEIAIFETDFGVRFGVFICADIFFKDPALILVREKNITDFIWPSWSFADLSFGLAIQFELGWSYMTDSNFLASGVNSMEQGSSGSGIYAGKKGPVVYIQSERNQTRTLTAKLYKKGKEGQSEGKILEPLNEGVDSVFEVDSDNFNDYKTHLLTPDLQNKKLTRDDNTIIKYVLRESINKTICQGSLCCEFFVNETFTYLPVESVGNTMEEDTSYVKNDSFYHYQYRLAAFNGVRGFPNSTATGLQVCAIISCLNDTLASCAQKTGNTFPLRIWTYFGEMFLHSTAFDNIYIKAVSKEKTDFTFPNVLESSKSESPKAFGSLPDVSKIDFSSDGFTSNFKFFSDKLMSMAIYSRIVARDGGKPGALS